MCVWVPRGQRVVCACVAAGRIVGVCVGLPRGQPVQEQWRGRAEATGAVPSQPLCQEDNSFIVSRFMNCTGNTRCSDRARHGA
ncbi:hypothetical protein AAHA92_06305 [Salvia divinorum]|uniref:Secreted protein n=1 Tax=Salvia divinorum TaxID=28513 RepID=A0ABD1I5A2_SALDI